MLRITFAALFMIAGVVQADDAPKLDWKEYMPEGGAYKILMPGKVKTMKQEAPSPGGKITIYMAIAAFPSGSVYMSTHNDIPGDAAAADTKTTLEGLVNGVKGKGELMLKKEITLGKDKIPGIEFIVDKGAQKMRGRGYMDKTKMYQVIVIGKSKDEVTSKDADKFLDSFEIMK